MESTKPLTANIVKLFHKPIAGEPVAYQDHKPVETQLFYTPSEARIFADDARLNRGLKAVILYGMPVSE